MVAKAQKVGTQVAAVSNKSITPSVIDEFENYAGVGFEMAKSKTDYAIPFLSILQGLSPGVQEGLEGYKPGLIINTVTKELSESLTVIPVLYTHTFTEWVPRINGGGFRGEFPAEDREEEFNAKLDRKTGRATLANGNELSDTRNFYVMVGHEDGSVSPALISMTSTQIAVAKNLNSLLNKKRRGKSGNLYTPAMAVNVLRLSTRQKSNAKGKWFVWDFQLLGDNESRDQIEQGLLLHEQVTAGKVKVDRTEDANDIGPEEEPENL